MAYALLDYDGYICKAYYAAIGRDERADLEEMEEILNNLTECAKEKSGLEIKKVISGHTYKKDIYPSYKNHRKKDEGLGMFRDYIKLSHEDLVCVPQLEADDVITMMYDKYPDSIVFSDDKDLRYYCPIYCKINLTEEISCQDDYINKQIAQMLYGDKEDGIDGIPKVGEKTAIKLLDMYGYDIKSVIKIYKDKEISIDECMKNLILVTPICKELVDDYKYGLDEQITMNNIIGHFTYFNKLIKEVYNNEN